VSGELSEEIDVAYDAERESDYRSSRLGASNIGNPCEAYLSFTLRGFPELKSSPRLKRIFRDGHRIEQSVIQDLRKTGNTVYDKDPLTGKQYMWDKHNGKIVFYADGIIEKNGKAKLLEVKSMNNSMWTRFAQRGLAVSHPKYYDQLQMGMGLSGYRESTLIAYNKNTSEYHDQTIEYDEIRYYFLLARAERVLMGSAERIGTDISDWRCKECSRRHVCFEGADVPKDKRTCANAFVSNDGWGCSLGCGDVCLSWKRFEAQPRSK